MNQSERKSLIESFVRTMAEEDCVTIVLVMPDEPSEQDMPYTACSRRCKDGYDLSEMLRIWAGYIDRVVKAGGVQQEHIGRLQ